MKRCMGCMRQMADYETICPHCGYEEGTDVREAFYLLPGTGLKSRYIVGRVLGCGGFGVTYISYDQMLSRPCAIKEYFPGTYATRGYGSKHLSLYAGGDAQEQFYAGLDSFMDEAKRQASLQRIPGIVRVYDSFRENNTGYIVMDLLEGKTIKEILRDRMQQRQNAAAGDGVNANAPETAGSGFPFSYEEAETIIREVLKTLSLVHAEGIIHRDIAPDNIFITNQNEIKLIDFGAARYAASQKTRSLSVILKPGYGPEEQYRRHGEQGPWTDVYGVGATFYKMLTGKTPMEAMDRLIEDRLIPPSKLGVAIRPQQEKVLLKSLGVRKEQRYQSAEEFRNALERAAGPSARTEPQDRKTGKPGKTGKPKQKGLLVAIVIAICALGAAAALLVLYNQQRRNAEELAELAEKVQGQEETQEETVAASKESERRAQEESEKAESERKAKEESERAESERKAREESEKAESERKAKEESERAESERKAKEESEKAESERQAKEESEKVETEPIKQSEKVTEEEKKEATKWKAIENEEEFVKEILSSLFQDANTLPVSASKVKWTWEMLREDAADTWLEGDWEDLSDEEIWYRKYAATEHLYVTDVYKGYESETGEPVYAVLYGQKLYGISALLPGMELFYLSDSDINTLRKRKTNVPETEIAVEWKSKDDLLSESVIDYTLYLEDEYTSVDELIMEMEDAQQEALDGSDALLGIVGYINGQKSVAVKVMIEDGSSRVNVRNKPYIYEGSEIIGKLDDGVSAQRIAVLDEVKASMIEYEGGIGYAASLYAEGSEADQRTQEVEAAKAAREAAASAPSYNYSGNASGYTGGSSDTGSGQSYTPDYGTAYGEVYDPFGNGGSPEYAAGGSFGPAIGN